MKKLILLILILLGIGYFVYSLKMTPFKNLGQVACTTEAKICPDGSAVGRSGPKCEFTECPALQEPNTAKLNQRIFNQGIYLTPLKVLGDSRCAADVTCIWAGSVSLKVKLESTLTPAENKEVTLTESNQVIFTGKRITLSGVTPAPNSKKTISDADYQFTFSIKNVDVSNSDFIKVSSPTPNAIVTSPLVITGEARGNWYFEASFPVRIYDANGKELGVVPAQAQGDWMTTEFVPFKATLNFTKPTTPTGTLVLQKDNPSGLPEFDDKISIPVRF